MSRTVQASLALVLALVLAAAFQLPAQAADPKIDAALKAFEQVAADPAKLTTYCAMAKLMDETGEDEKKATAAEPRIEAYMKALGPEFDDAIATVEALGEKAPETKVLDDTIDKIDQKCPK